MNKELSTRWTQASEIERATYLEEARKVLENLIHYRKGGSHEADDLQFVAASLFREHDEGASNAYA
jgi:hypothetical protein